jgi:transposase
MFGLGRTPYARQAMTTRYRCGACGNVTRFDVVATRRTRAFHHYSLGGDLQVEEEEVLDERVEQVTCRWCGASDAEQLHDQPS